MFERVLARKRERVLARRRVVCSSECLLGGMCNYLLAGLSDMYIGDSYIGGSYIGGSYVGRSYVGRE